MPARARLRPPASTDARSPGGGRRLGGVNRVPPVLVYTVLRLLAFLVPLGLLLALRIEPWIAAVLAAIIGLALSFVVLSRPRERVAEGLYERRHGNRKPDTTDEDAEDASASS